MNETNENKKNEVHQVKGAQAFEELSQVKASAKTVINDIVTISNLLASAASNGLDVKVTIEEGTEHTRARSVVVTARDGYCVIFYAHVSMFARTAFKVRGSVTYGHGGRFSNFSTVSEAITKLRGIVETNRLK
jgi:hypothetical protein